MDEQAKPRSRRRPLAVALAVSALVVAVPAGGALAGSGDSRTDGASGPALDVQDRGEQRERDKRDCPKDRDRGAEQSNRGTPDDARQL